MVVNVTCSFVQGLLCSVDEIVDHCRAPLFPVSNDEILT